MYVLTQNNKLNCEEKDKQNNDNIEIGNIYTVYRIFFKKDTTNKYLG